MNASDIDEGKGAGKAVPIEGNERANVCAYHIKSKDGVCALGAIKLMRDYLKQQGIEPPKQNPATVRALIEQLDVMNEAEIWRAPSFRSFVGSDKADKILAEFYKPPGPRDSTALLNNVHIDDALKAMRSYAEKARHKKFYHIPYQMIDFEQIGTDLAYLDPERLVRHGYDSFGVVINTDTSDGPGKHWFCLYGDLAHQGSKDDPYVIEFFNSSSNPARREIKQWFDGLSKRLALDHHKHVVLKKVVDHQLQHSNTECGVWCLDYIKGRLDGKPTNFFVKEGITDRHVMRSRAELFR